jgi:hypothetical protein
MNLLPPMPLVRRAAHPTDAQVIAEHPVYGGHLPHDHQIKEDWPFERKQALGAHIDRWHFPPSERE